MEIFRPKWDDYLPTYRDIDVLRERLEDMEYHLATFLTPSNMVNSLAFENGREKLLQFYSMDFDWQRRKIVEIIEETTDLNERFVKAALRAQRHLFIPLKNRILSYWNGVSWVSGLNGITPPWFATFAANLLDLKAGEKVLVVGFGYGYASAIFFESMEQQGHIYGIDVDGDTIAIGKKIIDSCGYENFHLKIGNGIEGWKDGYFDAVWPTLSTLRIPEAWTKELNEGGRLCVFRPLTKKEFEYALKHIEWFAEYFPTFDTYESKWWEETCLSTYKKEDGKMIEMSRLYDLFNPPFFDEEVGATIVKEWKEDLGVAESKLLAFLKQNLEKR